MSDWLSNWVQNQKQTRKFHPSWILLVVVVTGIVAGIIWIVAELVTRAEQDHQPPAAKLPVGARIAVAVPAEEAPARSIPWKLASGSETGDRRHRGRTSSL